MNAEFWLDHRIVITGITGFLGKHLNAKLLEIEPSLEIPYFNSFDYNLTKVEDIRHMLKDYNPTLIIHLAAVCGGIGANRARPATFFHDNAIMGIQLIEEARKFGVKKFVQLGTVCSYPKNTPVPFLEDHLWKGYPEETNAPYGLAKKMLLVQLQAYRQQYGFNGIYVLPVNLYGPHDHFDLENSHVIPAMIRKFVEAKVEGKKEVVLWGSGNVSREFLYVEDCADAIIEATELYNSPNPINIGSGHEVMISQLAKKIKELVEYEGEIVWDSSKPDGQPRRRLNTFGAAQEFGWRAKVDLEQGLKKTIEWYIDQISQGAMHGHS